MPCAKREMCSDQEFTFIVSGAFVLGFDKGLVVINIDVAGWSFVTPFQPTAASAHP